LQTGETVRVGIMPDKSGKFGRAVGMFKGSVVVA
jgi:hypothetical protein